METVDDILNRLNDYAMHVHQSAINDATESTLRVSLHDCLMCLWELMHDVEEAHRREVAVLLAKMN